MDKIWICNLHFNNSFQKELDCSYDNVHSVHNLLWGMFHATVMICAYFKTISYYFCVFGIDSARNWRIAYMLCDQVFGFLKIFMIIFCLSLSEILNQGKLPPGKIVSWKKASSKECLLQHFVFQKNLPRTLIHNIEKQNSFQI